MLSGEAVEFLRWTAGEAPDARGYWPAMAVANHALAGEAVIDNATASTSYPLFDGSGWDEAVCADCGTTGDRMPRVEMTGKAAGRVHDTDTVLAAGAVDALCEQFVAGADSDGDVLVLCGTTLIVWITIPEYREVPGLWTLPHSAAGKCQIGGPSNAGGLFIGWVDRLVGGAETTVEPGRVPVWAPYIRGERTPYHDPDRRGVLASLDLTHDGAAVRRAAFEASGFVVRQLIETERRIDVADRCHGRRDARRAVDAGHRRRHRAAGARLGVAEGAALGAAFIARMAAGFESSVADAARWASTERIVEPDEAWADPVRDRYDRFLELADGTQV